MKRTRTDKKVMISIAILLAGLVLTIAIGSGTTASLYQSPGTAIDFGERNVTWTGMNITNIDDPYKVLEKACDENEYTYTVDEYGTVTEINGIITNETHKWNLWVVEKGSTSWTKLSTPYKARLSDYTVSSWAYTTDSETPTVGVDSAGNSIYGYSQAYKTVTLSPSITEMVGALGASSTVVGTDRYSNYPEEIVKRQNSGDITIVGDYTTPIYESIVKVDPDVVFCDGAQYGQITMNERLRNAYVTSVLLYEGSGIDTILDNIYIIGNIIGYDIKANVVISELEYYCENIISNSSVDLTEVMAGLSPDASTWVAGEYTYMNDIISDLSANNIFSNYTGWVHINPEMVAKLNPTAIFVISSGFTADQGTYDSMMDNMSAEWRSTTAYKNGNVFLICEEAADMAQRAGPRYVQIMELISLMLDTDSDIPKYIGDDYRDHLTFTKDL